MRDAKEMFKHCLFALLLVYYSALILVNGQDQSGFISLDCGRLPKNSSYSEPSTGIKYISDEPFIENGVSKSILQEYKSTLQEQVAYVRSFPQGIRNCYRMNVTAGIRYLVRATFLYGNYDGLNQLPEFDLHLGVNFWDTVKFDSVIISAIKEIVHIPLKDNVQVCVVNTGNGTPFISALELRPLKNTTYVTPSGSLSLFLRADVGSTINGSYRYPYDVFDRLWLPYNYDKWTQFTTPLTVNPGINYKPASIVMGTAAIPINESSPMQFYWTAPDPSTVFYVYMYFAELQGLKANESRAFNITLNGDLFYGPLIPDYLNVTTIFSPAGVTGGNFTFSIVQLENSTLPPIFNGIEIYTLVDFSKSETEQDDVNAMVNIKSTYGVKKNWEGDPCLPMDYLWTGLNCSFDGDVPRITSLNLSSSGMKGKIASSISKLTSIESLDLSNNSLTGSVPNFLSRLPNLRVLNLDRNKLTGSVPAELIEKSESGLLSLSVGENLNLCASLSCETNKTTTTKKKNIIIPIAASIGGLLILLLIGATISLGLKRKRKPAVSINDNDSLESKKRQFTYSEVVKITNNFEKILGKGGFGTVYHGFIDENTQVAVKILSPPSVQGMQQSQMEEQERKQKFYYQQFQAEVKLLMRVHHGNLTSLVGYCNEGEKNALIYEFMANGDLDSHLSGSENSNVLSWDGRLQIARDAAQGLEYLHNGCKPPIVHRDVKTTNILLTQSYQAKIADFGLSKVFPTEAGATHVSTIVAGTPGYLDPEYYTTNRLNEKSDVFSFGVVLLEIITGRPAISRTHERTHIIQWVNSMLANGDIKSIVEPRLQGDFETNSVWKAVELAMACVSRVSTKRPTMSQVVTELKDCLAAEIARRNNSRFTDQSTTDSVDVLSMAMTTELNPLAR